MSGEWFRLQRWKQKQGNQYQRWWLLTPLLGVRTPFGGVTWQLAIIMQRGGREFSKSPTQSEKPKPEITTILGQDEVMRLDIWVTLGREIQAEVLLLF